MTAKGSLGVFNLLKSKKVKPTISEETLEIEGQYLTLEKQPKLLTNQETPYTCISYSWNSERKPNYFHNEELMAGRTIQVLKTALNSLRLIQNTPLNLDLSLWIDTFCVPPSGWEKETCLRNMGAIYGKASQVLVVLENSSKEVLIQIRKNDKINAKALLLLEQDNWPMRAWTYQEIVNGSALYFIAEGESEAPIPGQVFFDAVVKGRKDFQEKHGFDMLTMDSLYPNVGSLESVILDWRLAGYQKRSAYQVMASIETRKSQQPNEIIYAMIGAITADPVDDESLPNLSPEEYFMQVCEGKKDFSYIYTIGKRSSIKGRTWRPFGDTLKTVLPKIVCSGEGQKGTLYPTYLQLDDINLSSPSKTSKDKLSGLIDFYNIGDDNTSPSEWPQVIFQWLKKAGFSGCGEYLELEHGFFYPIEPLSSHTHVYVIISTGVRFLTGAPGLLVHGTDTDVYQTIGVGVFFGRAKLKNTVSVNVQ